MKNNFSEEWSLERLMDHIRRCLDRIAACGAAMELNTSGVEKNVPEFNPGPEILRKMKERDIPVVIGADAHVPERVGDGFDAALEAPGAGGACEPGRQVGKKKGNHRGHGEEPRGHRGSFSTQSLMLPGGGGTLKA